MNGMLRKLAAIPIAVAIAALVACADSVGPNPSAPLDAALRASPHADAPAGYRLVAGRVPAHVAERSASAVMGRSGGRLAVAGHELRVLGNTVDEPTTFSMRVLEDGYVGVELRAYRVTEAGDTIDVGAQGFNRRVTLVLKNVYVTEAVDRSKLEVVRVNPDGTLQAVPATWPDRNSEDIYAQLDRFSDYGLGWPF
jgi:hypothetical protein